MNDIMKIVQALKDCNILFREITETIKNETKKQNRGFLIMLLGTLGASLLGNLLVGKGIVRAGCGNKKGKKNCKSWLWKRIGFLMLPHPLTNFELERVYENKPRFNGGFQEIICLKK